jgi:hypothetical protein
MATATLWSNVQVAMESARAAGKTVSAIAKEAAPATVSATANGYSDGDYVVMDVTGMYQIDDRVFRVDNAALDAFDLEGETTTTYDTFAAGSAYKLTLGTTLAVLTSLSASGGGANFIDITTIHDNVAKSIPGLAAAATYSFEAIWDVADAGLAALKVASDQRAQKAFKFTFSNGQIMVFLGYVNATLLPIGSNQELVKTTVEITMFGTPTYYTA